MLAEPSLGFEVVTFTVRTFDRVGRHGVQADTKWATILGWKLDPFHLVQFQVPIVIPDEATDPVADPDSMLFQGMGKLIRSIPCLLQCLAMSTLNCLCNHFDFWIEHRSSSQNP